MKLDRRAFLRASCCAGTLALAPRLAFSATPSNADTLIVVFLRGGMDGLNVLVPYADPDYARLRPTMKIASPGSGGSAAIALDPVFALHPSLAPIEPLVRANRVAFVHATGFAQQSRSHFECMDRMERASLDLASVQDGWLGRHLAATSSGATFQGVGVGTAIQAALRGPVAAVGLSSIASFGLRTASSRKAEIEGVLDLIHAKANLLDTTARQAIAAVDELALANPGAIPVGNGAVYPATPFGAEMKEVAQLIKADVGLRAACVDLGGWDHHEGQANYLGPLLDELAKAIVALDTDLGARREKVTLVTVTEFGRRAKENASAGTDHGSAYAMAIYSGAGLTAGKVWADWPTLAEPKLRDGDLDITIDYRAVLSEMLGKRGGGSDFAAVFPGYAQRPPLGIFR